MAPHVTGLPGVLAGSGARIAVICTITPASTQAEETHNTLKFASRCVRGCLPASFLRMRACCHTAASHITHNFCPRSESLVPSTHSTIHPIPALFFCKALPLPCSLP